MFRLFKLKSDVTRSLDTARETMINCTTFYRVITSERTLRQRRYCHGMTQYCTSAESKDSNIIRVSAEVYDVRFNPFQSKHQILQAHITGRILQAQI